MRLSDWATEVLSSFKRGFDQQNCSVRNKIEDGIAIDTYEVKQGSNSSGVGVHLLSPLV